LSPIKAEVMNFLKMLVGVNHSLALLDVSVQRVKYRIVVGMVMLIHLNDSLHVLENWPGELRGLSKE
jgi:hypothetical protein